MSNIMEFLKLGANKVKYSNDIDAKELLKEIKNVMADIACANTWFEFEEDSDLLEACIYYTESLRARYRYLLKKAKLNNIVVPQ